MALTNISKISSLIVGDIPGQQNVLKIILNEYLGIVAQNLFAAERVFTVPPTTRASV